MSLAPWLRVALLVMFALGDAALSEDETPQPRVPRELALSLRAQGDAAVGAGRLEEALDLYTRWLEADPRDANTWYNLACVRARRADTAGALDAFETSLDAGFDDLDHARRDADLVPLHAAPRFERALAEAAARRTRDEPAGLVRHVLATTSVGSYIVLLPPDYATSETTYPIVVLLHGSGSTEVRHARVVESLGRAGIVYVAPRALHPHIGVFTGSAQPGWTVWPPERDPAEDLDAMALHADWIRECVDDVGRRYRTDTKRVALWGHSQGAAAAVVFAARHPARVSTLFAYAGYYPENHITAEALTSWKANNLRVELCHGTADSVVPCEPTRAMRERLTSAGVDHAVYLIEAQHGLTDDVHKHALAWLDARVRTAR